MRPQFSGKPARFNAQRGTLSIEFAIIFPALFLILYAIITYGLIFAAQQSLSLAAAEGGRAALRYQQASTPEEALTLRMGAASNGANSALTWLHGIAGPALTVVPTQTACDYAAALTCIRVRVAYQYAQAPLIPNLLGPLLALPTPSALHSEAIVHVSPANLL